jgi:hypothetical protein
LPVKRGFGEAQLIAIQEKSPAEMKATPFSWRGRDADCSAPPAEIRTCASTHTALTLDE